MQPFNKLLKGALEVFLMGKQTCEQIMPKGM